jgi:hypothetical protein
MVCFQTKNPNSGQFWRVLQCKMLVYFMDTWSILWSFVIFYGHLIYFFPFWHFVPRKIWQPCLDRPRVRVNCGDRSEDSFFLFFLLFFRGKNLDESLKLKVKSGLLKG